MSDVEDTVLVFTARSPERIVREGGSQAWVLNAARAKACTWLVCTQNRHNPDHEFSDATEAHGTGFLLGKIATIRRSEEDGDADRWLIAISEFAPINMPGLWDHGRNPVRYTALSALGIDPTKLKWQKMSAERKPLATKVSADVLSTPALTIAEAKKALAATFGVEPDSIEITIRG